MTDYFEIYQDSKNKEAMVLYEGNFSSVKEMCHKSILNEFIERVLYLNKLSLSLISIAV